MEHQEFSLSPMDHIMPRRHLFLSLYFPLSNPDITRIVSTFRSGLERMFEALPILSGTVQPARQSEQRGSLCVDAPWNPIDDVFHVNDLTSFDLDYNNLRQNHFPLTISEQYKLFSILTSRSNPFAVESPVVMAQVNFIRNGMILVPFFHHSVMDGLGAATVMKLWATFCRGENGADVISTGMSDRERLAFGDEAGRWEDVREYINGSEAYSSQKHRPVSSEASRLGRGINLANYGLISFAAFFKEKLLGLLLPTARSLDTSSPPQLPQKVDAEIFFFSRSSLATLRSVVSASVASAVPIPGDDEAPSHLSTNDALSALLFACVTEARRAIKSTDTPPVIPFALTVSARRLLNPPLPENYIGNMSTLCHLDVPLDSVTVELRNIAAIAHRIRRRLIQLDASFIRRLIGALRTADDISKVAPAYRASKDWKFMISPWTRQGYYSMDWGSEIGAKCERVRTAKPSGPMYDGVNVIFPELKDENGAEEGAGLEVMVVLEEGAMRRLKGMEEWTRWAQWRCN